MVLVEEVSDDEANEGGVDVAWKKKIDEETPEQKAEREKRFEEERKKEAARVENQFALGEKYRQEGNALFAKAEYDSAIKKWEEAMQELRMVGNEPENRKKYEKASVVLYLNMAQAHLKSNRPEDAKSSASMALIDDQKNVKGLYRRALAQAQLARQATLYQDAEARAAIADLEMIMDLEPENKDAKQELSRVRRELRDHERDLVDKQRGMWGQVFGGRTIVEGEEEREPEGPPPAVRKCYGDGRKTWIKFSELGVSGGIQDLNLELREGWCVGLDCSTGCRAAFCQLLKSRRKPDSGSVIFSDKKDELVYVPFPIVVALYVLFIAVLIGFISISTPPYARKVIAGFFAFLIFLAVLIITAIWWSTLGAIRCSTVVMSSSRQFSIVVPAGASLEDAIGDHLPKKLVGVERRERVIAILRAAGFQLHKRGEPYGTPWQYIRDGVKFGELSESEQRIILCLRCLVMKPTVLVCDNPLEGIDAKVQIRLLKMIKRMKQDLKTTVLFLSDDPHHLRYISDSVGLVQEDKVVELGPTEQVFKAPRSQEMQEYIAKVLADSGCKEWKQAGAAFQEEIDALVTDNAMNAKWLPNFRGELAVMK